MKRKREEKSGLSEEELESVMEIIERRRPLLEAIGRM